MYSHTHTPELLDGNAHPPPCLAGINRVGTEKPWNLGRCLSLSLSLKHHIPGHFQRRVAAYRWLAGRFYGSSYFVDPRGQIFAQASEDKDELLVATFDLDMIEQVRSVWQFFRDRRPETYGDLCKL